MERRKEEYALSGFATTIEMFLRRTSFDDTIQESQMRQARLNGLAA